jgi:hypothetical protein
LRRALVEAAYAASRKKDRYLAAQYARLARGGKKWGSPRDRSHDFGRGLPHSESGWKTYSRGHKYRGVEPYPICWPKGAAKIRKASAKKTSSK